MGQLDGQLDAERAVAGDAAALQRVWAANRRWVAAVLLAHKPRDSDLEDLLQDVAMNMVRKISDVRDPGALRPWLRRLAVNAARTEGRKRRTRLRLARPAGEGAGMDALPAANHGPDDGGERAEGMLDLARRLHPDYREPLLLQCMRGMSQKQIAEALGLPVTTIETRLARARRMLREEVEFEEDASSMRITRRGDAGAKGASS